MLGIFIYIYQWGKGMLRFYVLRVEVFLSGFENSQGVYSTNRERRRVNVF